VCENTPVGRVRCGDGPGWAGKILKNTWEVNRLPGNSGINGWAGIFPSEPKKYLTSKRGLEVDVMFEVKLKLRGGWKW
jgi:hypothetical protein